MKRAKTKLLTSAIAIVLLLLSATIGLGGIFAKAFADGKITAFAHGGGAEEGGGNGGTKTIYYFSDSTPIISESDLSVETEAEVNQIQYSFTDSTGFSSLYQDGTFDNINADIAIFQFMSIVPQAETLMQLFTDFKNKDSKILFLSKANLGEYDDTAFMSCVDDYLNVATDEFYNFISESVMDIRSFEFPKNNFCILIDRCMVDLTLWARYDIFDSSAFLRGLLEQLNAQLGLGVNLESYDNVSDGYIKIAKKLTKNEKNIQLLLDIGGNSYLNLTDKCAGISDETVYAHVANLDDLTTLVAQTSMQNIKVCAMGISYLEQDFYDFLFEAQSELENEYHIYLPVFIWEAEPLEDDPNALKVITDTYLRETYEVPGGAINEFFIYNDGMIITKKVKALLAL